MSSITDLRFWYDVGYTDGCIEVPRESDSLPTADVIITGSVNPSKDRMFSQLRISEAFSELINASYLRVTFDMNNGTDQTFYGWVDSVSVQSDTEDYPVTIVDWHVDLWRTYLSKAEFGSGMVKRRPTSTDIPPQPYPHRFVTPSMILNLSSVRNTHIWWVFARYNVTQSSATSSWWLIAPVNIASTSAKLCISGSADNICPSLDEWASGKWDELMNLSPTQISFMFISPVPPFDYTGAGTSSSPISLTNPSSGYGVRAVGQRFCYFNDGAVLGEEIVQDLTFDVQTTDTETVVITGFDGEPIGALPWGFNCVKYGVRVIASSNTGAVQVRFMRTEDDTDSKELNVMGFVFSAICPTLELGSNSWSDYVYSGARQAEIRQRELNTESQKTEGTISMIGGTVSGAISGALIGSAVPGIGTVVGGLIGAAGGALAGAISTGGNYEFQTNTKNDQMQAVSDYAASRQFSTQLLAGSGFDFLETPYKGLKATVMQWDSYSQEQRSNDISMYGANVSEPTQSCQSLVDAGGPLQIVNLVVRGDIPVQAKQYFRQRFAQGVRIV